MEILERAPGHVRRGTVVSWSISGLRGGNYSMFSFETVRALATKVESGGVVMAWAYCPVP